MHELPEGLSKSLRSWRGSVYSNSTRNEPADAEKGAGDFGEKAFERALSPTGSSLVLHPSASHHALSQARQASGGQHRLLHHDAQADLHQQGAHHNPAGAVGSPQTVARRAPNAPPQTPASAKKSVFTQPKVDDPDPAADRIAATEEHPLSHADFYQLIGMHAPSTKTQNPKDLAIRHGLYGKIHYELEYVQTKYRIYDVLTYAFLILQLLLSAVFIVLGSLTHVNSHIAIAVLGAISTIIAGVLAAMKGQGLPNRLRQTRDSLRNVVFEAEELYWDVGVGREVYFRDIVKLREDYLRVMEEARRNHPDTWNATNAGIAKGVETAPGKKPVLAPGATPKV